MVAFSTAFGLNFLTLMFERESIKFQVGLRPCSSSTHERMNEFQARGCGQICLSNCRLLPVLKKCYTHTATKFVDLKQPMHNPIGLVYHVS
eukprot:1161266-Pelagomonas_calceolata.AAC.9